MKTIKITFGIKLILIAVITITGISLFSAFKQSEGSKKYLNLVVNFKQIVIIDENNKIESVINADREYGAYFQQINLDSIFKITNVIISNYITPSSTSKDIHVLKEWEPLDDIINGLQFMQTQPGLFLLIQFNSIFSIFITCIYAFGMCI